MIEVSWNWSCLALHVNKAKVRIFLCAMNIRSPYLPPFNHSLICDDLSLYVLHVYMQTSFSSFYLQQQFSKKSHITFHCVRPKSIKTFEGPNYRVTYSSLMCPYTSFISSLVSWPISKKNISNFSLVYTFSGTLCHSQEATNEILTHGIFHDIKFKRILNKAYTFEKLFEVIL